MEIVVGKEITSDFIRQALDLDNKAYPDDFILTLERCLEYEKHNSEIYFMLIDDGKVIGYINFSPIRKEIYNRILSGEMLDTAIAGDDVVPYKKGNDYYGYLSSIVIDEQYRRCGYATKLLQVLVKKLIDLKKKGIIFNGIVADVLTEGGKRIAEKLGMTVKKISNHGSLIYEAVFNPLKIIKTELNRDLVRIYEGDMI